MIARKYQKKPITLEAWQWKGSNFIDIYQFCPQAFAVDEISGFNLYIKTLKGVMKADINDYIIKGIKGEFYPCKPDIFKEYYEEVSE